MKSNLIKIVLASLLSSALCSFLVYLALGSQMKKTAVVDAVRLFNSYKMKAELEEKAKQRLDYLGHQADSLNQVIGMAQKTGAGEQELSKLAEVYQYAQVSLEQEYQKSNNEINEQVWKRLNPLIDEYGKKEGLHLIIGANGMGSVLYNDNYYDHTDQVISYVNGKYEKGN